MIQEGTRAILEKLERQGVSQEKLVAFIDNYDYLKYIFVFVYSVSAIDVYVSGLHDNAFHD
jgi:hypothetical protein